MRQSRKLALAVLREIRSVAETEKAAAAAAAPIGSNHSFTDDVDASFQFQSLATPHTDRRNRHASIPQPGSGGFAHDTAEDVARAGGGAGAGASSRGAVDQRVQDSAELAHGLSLDESPSFMSPSSVDMSVAMSMGSESGGEAEAANERDGEGDVGLGDSREEAGEGESIGDLLSP